MGSAREIERNSPWPDGEALAECTAPLHSRHALSGSPGKQEGRKPNLQITGRKNKREPKPTFEKLLEGSELDEASEEGKDTK